MSESAPFAAPHPVRRPGTGSRRARTTGPPVRFGVGRALSAAPSFQVNSEMQVRASASSGATDGEVKLTQDRCSTGADQFPFESLEARLSSQAMVSAARHFGVLRVNSVSENGGAQHDVLRWAALGRTTSSCSIRAERGELISSFSRGLSLSKVQASILQSSAEPAPSEAGVCAPDGLGDNAGET
jgi:hypothetical protein